MYIIELEKGIWLAPWEGDPGRTLKKENARRFRTKKEANRMLIMALLMRQFKGSRVINLGESNEF